MKERNKRMMIEKSMSGDLEGAMDKAAKKGRGTDDTVGHLTKGEVIIPVQIMSDPKNKQMIADLFKSSGGNLDEFTVGHEKNKINPETGQPEFVWWVPLVAAAATVYSVSESRKSASEARDQARRAQAESMEQARLARETAAAEAQKSREAAIEAARLSREQSATESQKNRELQASSLEQQKSDAAARLQQTQLTADEQRKLMENLTSQQSQAAEAAKVQLAEQQKQYQEQKISMEKAAADQAAELEAERRKIAQRESSQMTARRRSGRRALLSDTRLTPETGLAGMGVEDQQVTSLRGY
jgi:hypothetical protein